MKSNLKDWLNNGWLTEHKTSSQEITGLLAVVDRNIADAEIIELSLDARLSIAYSSIIQCAKIALAVCGYRVTRESAHYRSIESLELTLNISSDTITVLDEFRKKRNILEYDRIGATTIKEINEILLIAKEIRAKVEDWIKQKNPQLLNNY